MSKRGTDFRETWISENINAGPDDDSEANFFAEECLADAAQAGISKEEIEEDVGNLVDYMLDAMGSATNREVDRLVLKDN